MLNKLKPANAPFLSKCERFNFEPNIKSKSINSNKDITNKNLMKGIKIQNNFDNNTNNIYKYGNNYRISESGNISNEISNYSSTNK